MSPADQSPLALALVRDMIADTLPEQAAFRAAALDHTAAVRFGVGHTLTGRVKSTARRLARKLAEWEGLADLPGVLRDVSAGRYDPAATFAFGDELAAVTAAVIAFGRDGTWGPLEAAVLAFGEAVIEAAREVPG